MIDSWLPAFPAGRKFCHNPPLISDTRCNVPVDNSQFDEDLTFQNRILQHVSRTFALTIPQLPEGLRDVIGNAYLLCRIADTIEDDKDLPIDQQTYFARLFVDVVKTEASAQEFADQLHPKLSATASDAEKDLIKNTAAVIRITHSFNQRQQESLARCVDVMAEGMVRYQQAETLAGVPDQPAMDEYCYFVAGVVGEMLTELFCDYSPEIHAHYAELMPLAVSFGQALQMTNILKDIWDDHERGACWLPADLFQSNGFTLADKQPGQSDPAFNQSMGTLIAIARGHLENALRYTLIIPANEPGIRKFCLWALGMAVLTLRKIDKKRDFQSGNEVKISRNSVKATIISTNLCVRHDKLLNLLFKMTAHSLPEQGVS